MHVPQETFFIVSTLFTASHRVLLWTEFTVVSHDLHFVTQAGELLAGLSV